MPSIGKIETEIENGEDVTEPNYRNISPVAASQLISHAASDNAPARTRHGLAMWNYLPSRVLVALIANKIGKIYSSSYFMPSAKFLTYGGILLCLLLAL